MAKDFKDFTGLIDHELFMLTAKEINDQNLKTKIPVTQEGMKDFVTNIVAVNTMVFLKILKQYHLWLNE